MFYALPAAMKRITALQDYQVGFHTHSNESRFDVEKTIERYGTRRASFRASWIAGDSQNFIGALRLAG